MQKPYSQVTAMLAITRASLKAVFRSPSAVIFGLAFPLIFILVFGFIGGRGGLNMTIAFANSTDTTLPLYQAIRGVPGIKVSAKSEKEIREELEKGRMTAIININKHSDAPYQISLTSSEAVNPQSVQVLRSIIESIIRDMDKRSYPQSR